MQWIWVPCRAGNKVMGIENATGLLAYTLPGKNNSNWVQAAPITYAADPSLQ